MTVRKLRAKLEKLRNKYGDEFATAEYLVEAMIMGKIKTNTTHKEYIAELINLCVDLVLCNSWEEEEKIGEIESFLR